MSAVINPDLPGRPSANEPIVTSTITDKPEAVPARKRQPSARRRRTIRQQPTADSAEVRQLPHESMTLFWGGSYGTRII